MTWGNEMSHYLLFWEEATGSWSPTKTSWYRALGFCFLLFFGQPQNPLVQKAPRSMRFILPSGCFLAVTTGHVLKTEWGKFSRVFPLQPPHLLPALGFFFKSTFVWVTFADNPTKHYPQKDRACPLATFPFSIIIILCHQCRETVDHHCRLKPITQSHDLRLSLLENMSFSVSFWKLNVERMWMWK